MSRYHWPMQTILVLLILILSAFSVAAAELVIEGGAHHLGDTTNSNWSPCATSTPEGDSWSTSFPLTTDDFQRFHWLSIDHCEIEGYTDVYVNGVLAKRIPRDYAGPCEWTTTVIDVRDMLFVGSNDVEIRASFTSSGGTEYDDMAFQSLKLEDFHTPPLIIDDTGDHLGDTTNSVYAPCLPSIPSGECATLTFDLDSSQLAALQTLVLAHTEVENYATVELNGTPLGELPRDGFAPCEFRNFQFDVTGITVEGTNSLEICADSTASGVELDDFGFTDVQLMDFAISSVADVPNDQGGWIRIVWSAKETDTDAVGEITSYGLWRRLDSAPSSAKVNMLDLGSLPEAIGILSPDLAAQAGFPSGWWEGLGSVPAVQNPSYSAVVPSLADLLPTDNDPPWTDVLVTAHTADPTRYYSTQEASGVSVDNLAPAAPSNITVTFGAGNTIVSWDANTESDLDRYVVYRDLIGSFDPVTAIADTITASSNSWSDSSLDPWQYEYHVAALDTSGNLSPLSGAPNVTTSVDTPAMVRGMFLAQNVPNPFNPSTTIDYELRHESDHVSLRVFDARGRLVRVLVDETQDPGPHQVIWNGRDDRGQRVSSGIYSYSLRYGSETASRKMTLVQ